MTPRKMTRQSVTRRKRSPEDRRFAQSAYAEAASIATSLGLLLATEAEGSLDSDKNALSVSGIHSKCLTACATLPHLEQRLGGAQ